MTDRLTPERLAEIRRWASSDDESFGSYEWLLGIDVDSAERIGRMLAEKPTVLPPKASCALWAFPATTRPLGRLRVAA